MLCNSVKKFLYENRWTIILFVSLFFFTTDAFAGDGENTGKMFGSMEEAMNKIFHGLRKVIYPASTIGIACVCIAGMFGNFNWKWLAAILLGVFIITYAEGVGDIATSDLSGNS